MVKTMALVESIVILLTIYVALPLEAQANNVQEKAIVEDQNMWDFKEVIAGEKVTHTFSIENKSLKSLQILNVHASCGCTTSEVKNKTLAPGESTQLEVTFDSTGYTGEVTQYVFVHTDDPERAIIRFVIKAMVVSESKRGK